ncbi:MAG: cyanophycinase [Planctomycetes bacterium]|nr:cyanophycinase [Planctomycetota bacterium]
MRKAQVTIMHILSFLLTILLFITSVTAQTSLYRITLDKNGKQLQMPYYCNFPLDIPNTEIERAVIVHHGASRNPYDYFSYVVNSARTVGCEGNTIIIAPHILTESDLATHKLEDDPLLAFFPNGWRGGDNSRSTDVHPRAITASNFEFYDEMITQLADRDIFPNLKTMVFTGHSAGGQVANRYAAGTKVPDTVLRPAGIHIRFVVANPSTFVYFTPERRIAGTLDQFAPPTSGELEEALDYNHYKYGLEGLNEYMSAVGPEQIRLQYQRREVNYLLGDQDLLSNNLDTSDGAMLQGNYRYERGQIYHNYVRHVFGPGTGRLHKKVIVNGIGHSGNAMYNSYQGRKVLFDYDPKPELIEPIDGALVIGGGGGMPQPVWDRFMELAGGNDARLVIIPTADGDADDLDPDEYLTKWRTRNPASVVILHTRSQEVANDPDFVAPLKQATGVWFGGGSQSRIADAYVGTLVEKELYGVLERGWVIGGSSAGAAIQCRTMIRGGDEVPRMMRGLDFLPGSIIDQHFLARGRQKRLISAVKDHTGMVGFGIDEKTALIVTQGSHIDIVGESCVMVYAAGSDNLPFLEEKLESQGDDPTGLHSDLLAWSSTAQARLQPQFSTSEKMSLETLTRTNEKLLTACEKSDFERYCTHEEMMAYLEKVNAGSQDMLLSTYGNSVKGRELVYAVFSRPMVTNPFEAMTSSKPIVILDAGVHGNERVLRESNLILIRELAEQGSEMNALLDDLVVIMVPCLNPDGTELDVRRNANDNDINRDYIKLDEPETQGYVSNMLQKWHPHIQIGGHNCGYRPYNMLYLAPTNAAADPALANICDEEIFPLVGKNLEAGGYNSFYYSNGNEERWEAGSPSPNIFRNYGGISNYISIVFESPRGQSLEDGIKSGIISYKSILEYCSENPDKVMGVVDKARKKTIELGQKALGEIPVQMRYIPEDYKVSYLLGKEAGIPVESGIPTAITVWAPLPDDEEEIRVDYWQVDNFDDDSSDPEFADGEMHFVALTITAGGSELWSIENGTASSLGRDDDMVPGGDWTEAVINVGDGGAAAEWADGFWEGEIGFVGVWNRVLSPSELSDVPLLDVTTKNKPTNKKLVSSDMLVHMTFDELTDPLGNELELFGDAKISNGNLILDGEGDHGEITGGFGETIGIGQVMTIVLSIASDVEQDYRIAAPFGMGHPDVGSDEEPSVGRITTEITDADLLKKPVATKTRPRPYAYLLPHDAKKAIDLLKMHNITVEVLQKEAPLAIEAYVLEDIGHEEEHNHPEATFVTVADEAVKKVMTFPKGTYVVRTGQVMGRMISHMLEPETPENIIIWNIMDDLLPQPGPDSLIPIYKLTKPTALPLVLSKD